MVEDTKAVTEKAGPFDFFFVDPPGKFEGSDSPFHLRSCPAGAWAVLTPPLPEETIPRKLSAVLGRASRVVESLAPLCRSRTLWSLDLVMSGASNRRQMAS